MRKIIIFYSTLLLLGCNHRKNKHFDVYDFSLKPNNLEHKGYERVLGVDVIMYEKVTKDTLYSVTFYLEKDRLIPLTQDWTFKLKSINSLENYLIERNIYPLDEILRDRKTSFINNDGNIVYVGYFVDNSNYKIVYYIPSR